MKAFWDIALCSFGVDRRFRGAYCLHHQCAEILVYSNAPTPFYSPEGSRLHTHRCEKLKYDNYSPNFMKPDG
jgi:hypothetical protein